MKKLPAGKKLSQSVSREAARNIRRRFGRAQDVFEVTLRETPATFSRDWCLM